MTISDDTHIGGGSSSSKEHPATNERPPNQEHHRIQKEEELQRLSAAFWFLSGLSPVVAGCPRRCGVRILKIAGPRVAQWAGAELPFFSPCKLTAVRFEPKPLRTGAWSQRLRPLGQTVMFSVSGDDFI